jgi:hypothetical protein
MTAPIVYNSGERVRARIILDLARVIGNADRMTAGEFTARTGQLWTRIGGVGA